MTSKVARTTDEASREGARQQARAADRAALGAAIRRTRETQRRTLSDVAGEARVSPSLLSQIERGLVAPSLDSLRDIAEALGTAPFRLLVGNGVPSHLVVRKGDGTILPIPEFAEFRLLSRSLHGSFEVGRWTLEPGRSNTREARSHGGEEANLILGGRARLELGGDEVMLSEGDFITFDARLPHRVVAVGTTTASALFVVSPPTF